MFDIARFLLMETDFDPDIPEVPCLPGEINPVILNIIVNAAHGIVVKKHGGALDFETEIGKGTTFVIRLPLEKQSVEEAVS